MYLRGVPLPVRIGTAVRWTRRGLTGESADIVRTLHDGGVHLALMANAFQCAFSTCWPTGSRLILDLFIEAWDAAAGPIRERLLTAFEQARERFAARAPTLPPDPDFLDSPPAAVLLAVATDGAAVHMAWIGGDVAFVARGSRIIAETTPHTLLERIRRERPDITDLSNIPSVLVRTITAGERKRPDYLVTEVAAGDTVVLLSRAAFHVPCVPVRDAALTAAAYRSPAALAELLAQRVLADTDAPYAAVAVIRVEDVDLSKP